MVSRFFTARASCLLLVLLQLAPIAAADEADTTAKLSAEKIESIARLVEQLDDDSFKLREAATEALVKFGPAAATGGQTLARSGCSTATRDKTR